MFRLLRFRTAALLIIFLGAGTAIAKPAQRQSRSAPMLDEAETAAQKIVERFHQTLDFGGIFAQQFVTEPRLRSRAVSIDEEDKWKQFDLPTRERIYVSMLTWLHLWSEYMLIQKENDEPPEIANLPEPRFFSGANPPKTVSEVNAAILELENLSAVYRKYFSARVFQSAQYRESIRKEAEYAKSHSHNVPRVEKGNAKFGIPETVPVYVVRPEAFDYYFIRENGTMKLFYINILPNFRLF